MKRIIMGLLTILFLASINGCVNLDQKTKLEKDGSGTINLEYWAKMSNVNSNSDLGGFSFNEAGVRSKYASSNNEITDLKIEDKLDDSTKHVKVSIKFKDLNNLSSCAGFSKVKSEWKETEEGMSFKYTLQQDTSASKTMGASDYKLTYEFDMPDEVISTNGIKDGSKAKWEKTHADLKKDIEMTATVKGGKSGKCGLFGFEMPLIILAGLMIAGRRKIFKKRIL